MASWVARREAQEAQNPQGFNPGSSGSSSVDPGLFAAAGWVDPALEPKPPPEKQAPPEPVVSELNAQDLFEMAGWVDPALEAERKKKAAAAAAAKKRAPEQQLALSGSDGSWWNVDEEGGAATVLVERCMRFYGWEEDFAIRVLQGYRVFLDFKRVFQDWDATKLAPSSVIDQMWQAHILDTLHYSKDCQLLLGQYAHYNPDSVIDPEAHSGRIQNTRNALSIRIGPDFDEEVWTFDEGAVQNVRVSGRAAAAGPAPPPAFDAGAFQRDVSPEVVSKSSPRKYDEVFLDFQNAQNKPEEQVAPPLPPQDFGPSGPFQGRAAVGAPADKSPRKYDEVILDFNKVQAPPAPPPVRRNKPSKRAGSSGAVPTDPAAHEDNGILIRVCNRFLEESYFRIKRNTQMAKIFETYAAKNNVKSSDLIFRLDGEAIKMEHTPEMLGLEDQDTIDVIDVCGGISPPEE